MRFTGNLSLLQVKWDLKTEIFALHYTSSIAFNKNSWCDDDFVCTQKPVERIKHQQHHQKTPLTLNLNLIIMWHHDMKTTQLKWFVAGCDWCRISDFKYIFINVLLSHTPIYAVSFSVDNWAHLESQNEPFTT